MDTPVDYLLVCPFNLYDGKCLDLYKVHQTTEWGTACKEPVEFTIRGPCSVAVTVDGPWDNADSTATIPFEEGLWGLSMPEIVESLRELPCVAKRSLGDNPTFKGVRYVQVNQRFQAILDRQRVLTVNS